jgi:trehalose-6-phosphate synthase
MWTRESLHDMVQERLRDYVFVAVSNREPYIHTRVDDDIQVQMPASGLTVALDPVMRACGGVWVAHGSGQADRDVVDEADRVMVPPEDPQYHLKRVWLTKEEEEGYYYGFSNEALWPLCHVCYTRPLFDENDWRTYKRVNELFAKAVLEEVGDRKAFVFVQDYHLALVPRLLREANPNCIIAHFWHIPWPNPEAFRICPWQDEILDGLLGSHVLGFHIPYHCNNFMDNIDRSIEARVDRERSEVIRRGKRTAVRPFPISIDFEGVSYQAQQEAVGVEATRLKRKLGLYDMAIGVGLDRIDYTKGIPDRFRALDRFFDRCPEYRGKVVFIQAGVASRIHISTYRRLNEEIDNLVEEINWKHALGPWRPIIDLRGHLAPLTLMALRRLADFWVVSSLHDGMNLVAKEFVASSFDERGALLLSHFTGAARELSDAILVNPYATDAFAGSVQRALEMPLAEKRRQMQRMRAVVQEHNVFKWAADIILEMLRRGPADWS